MRPLSSSELLAVWDAGLAQPPLERALALLAAADDTRPEAMASLPIGQRDGRLLTLREWTFGERVAAVTTCTGCRQDLELDFSVAQIRADAPGSGQDTMSLARDQYAVRFRTPTSADLMAIRDAEPALWRQLLLERCVVEAHRDGEPVAAARLPAVVVDAVVDQMAESDPQADVQLAVSCSACGRSWRAVFDIASYFWSEIDAWAGRMLREVHILASAYSWAECEILALSPRRRRIYLEMASGWTTS
jgi:hypothetical protein